MTIVLIVLPAQRHSGLDALEVRDALLLVVVVPVPVVAVVAVHVQRQVQVLGEAHVVPHVPVACRAWV